MEQVTSVVVWNHVIQESVPGEERNGAQEDILQGSTIILIIDHSCMKLLINMISFHYYFFLINLNLVKPFFLTDSI
jgi:hypothetical protein